MKQRSDLAKQVLPISQQTLKPLVEEFSHTHILVGGTAIALQLGHRESIDFDLFSFGQQGSGKSLMKRITDLGYTPDPSTNTIQRLSEAEQSEAHCVINGVKISLIDFSRNPFDIHIDIGETILLEGNICTLSLLKLGAMKCYAMMYRSKRKDAVDVYMILQQGYTLTQLTTEAKSIFKDLYQPKATLETIINNGRDMTEKVSRKISSPPSDIYIQEYLVQAVKVAV